MSTENISVTMSNDITLLPYVITAYTVATAILLWMWIRSDRQMRQKKNILNALESHDSHEA